MRGREWHGQRKRLKLELVCFIHKERLIKCSGYVIFLVIVEVLRQRSPRLFTLAAVLGELLKLWVTRWLLLTQHQVDFAHL